MDGLSRNGRVCKRAVRLDSLPFAAIDSKANLVSVKFYEISLWLSSLRTPELFWNADEIPHMYVVKGSCLL